MKWLLVALLSMAVGLLAGCSGKDSSEATSSETASTAPTGGGAVEMTATDTTAPTKVEESEYTTMPNGLKYAVLKPGSGPEAEHQPVTVHYTGWLEDGTKFDSSVDRGESFQFTLGHGEVIPGWDEGVKGMKVGEKRQLVVPADMGYGPSGTPDGTIPPNATLIFDVELLGVGEPHAH